MYISSTLIFSATLFWLKTVLCSDWNKICLTELLLLVEKLLLFGPSPLLILSFSIFQLLDLEECLI